MDKEKYLEAVDVVCLDCCGNEDDCEKCKVRETTDLIANKEK